MSILDEILEHKRAEVARRKARLQVQRAINGEADEGERPTALDEYRKALGG